MRLRYDGPLRHTASTAGRAPAPGRSPGRQRPAASATADERPRKSSSPRAGSRSKIVELGLDHRRMIIQDSISVPGETVGMLCWRMRRRSKSGKPSGERCAVEPRGQRSAHDNRVADDRVDVLIGGAGFCRPRAGDRTLPGARRAVPRCGRRSGARPSGGRRQAHHRDRGGGAPAVRGHRRLDCQSRHEMPRKTDPRHGDHRFKRLDSDAVRPTFLTFAGEVQPGASHSPA